MISSADLSQDRNTCIYNLVNCNNILSIYMSLVVRKSVFVFWSLTSSDTNRAVQPQKMDRGFKFRTWKVEELYYLSSKNKGSDQLRCNRETDLCLCFCICKKTTTGFLMMRLI